MWRKVNTCRKKYYSKNCIDVKLHLGLNQFFLNLISPVFSLLLELTLKKVEISADMFTEHKQIGVKLMFKIRKDQCTLIFH